MRAGRLWGMGLAALLLISAAAIAQDSLNVTQVGQAGRYWDDARRVVIRDNYAYVTTYETGLRIVDISDPYNPCEVGFLVFPGGEARSVFLLGNYAYVAVYLEGLFIVDISDPSNSFVVGFYEGCDTAHDVVVSGDYAYVAESSVYFINVHDPSNPYSVGSFYTGGSADGIALQGNYVYVAAYGDGLFVLDISDPGNPVGLGHSPDPDLALDVTVSGNYAYVASWYGLSIVDISNPQSVSQVGFFEADAEVHDTAISGSIAYIANYTAGVRALDVSDPTNPTELGSMGTPGNVRGVAASGTYLYVADTYGLITASIAQPANPSIISSYQDWEVYDLGVSGNHAYLTNGREGIRVVDISDLANPVEELCHRISGEAHAIAVWEDHLYVAALYQGLRIINVSNPAHPFEEGFYDTPGIAWDVAFDGNYAYVADRGRGLRIINVADPANPFEESSFTLPRASALVVAASGDHAYVYFFDEYDYFMALIILNVSDPANPYEEALIRIENVSGLAISEDYLYVAGGDYPGGVHIYDVSDPANPTPIGQYSLPTGPQNVSVSGSSAFIADYNEGLYVLDVENPSQPTLAGFYHTPGTAYGVAGRGDYALVADLYYLGIYDCSAATGGLEDLSVTLTPVNPPISIPPGGGSFNFDLEVESVHSTPVTYDLWIQTTLPNGTISAPNYIMTDLTLAPNSSMLREDLLQTIPDSAASGIYTFTANIGIHPELVCASDNFQFTKSVDTLWTRTLGSDEDDYGFCVQQTTDGGYIITGMTQSYGVSYQGILLLKTDADGNEVWHSVFGGGEYNEGQCVRQTSDGGYIIAGSSDQWSPVWYDVCLIKTDDSGHEIWTQHYGGNNHDQAYGVRQTTDGGYIVVGFTCSHNAYYALLIKTDASGNVVWSQNYSFGGAFGNFGYSVQQTADGGYIVTGDSDWDILLLKTDGQGNEIWSRLFPVGNYGLGYCVQQTSDGGYIIAGYSDFTGSSDDMFLLKTDALGNQVWLQTYGGFANDQGYSVQQTTDGGYVICGKTNSYGAGSSDVYLVKTDPWGEMIWEHTFGGSNADYGYSAQQTTDNGYIVTGSTYFSGVGSDVYLIRLAPQSLDNFLCGEVPSAEMTVVPLKFSLVPPYPNPFNPTTVISFTLPAASRVSLQVYDLAGRSVMTLVNGWRDSGEHEVTFDGSELPSGIYLAKLTAGDWSAVQKLVLLK